jgi:hypothetical protein
MLETTSSVFLIDAILSSICIPERSARMTAALQSVPGFGGKFSPEFARHIQIALMAVFRFS